MDFFPVYTYSKSTLKPSFVLSFGYQRLHDKIDAVVRVPLPLVFIGWFFP